MFRCVFLGCFFGFWISWAMSLVAQHMPHLYMRMGSARDYPYTVPTRERSEGGYAFRRKNRRRKSKRVQLPSGVGSCPHYPETQGRKPVFLWWYSWRGWGVATVQGSIDRPTGSSAQKPRTVTIAKIKSTCF